MDRMLADISLSLIPGETQSLSAQPSLTSEVLLQSISTYSQRKIDDRYVENLLKYKEIIEVDHSVNYIRNDSLVIIMPDVTGAGMVHYAVEPERLSLSAHEGKYTLELKAYGKVTDRRNVTIYQFEKPVPLEFTSEDLEELKRKRFSFQDVFPLLPGEYDFDLLLKNTASQEFTSFEKRITVPEPATTAALSPWSSDIGREPRRQGNGNSGRSSFVRSRSIHGPNAFYAPGGTDRLFPGRRAPAGRGGARNNGLHDGGGRHRHPRGAASLFGTQTRRRLR